MILKKYTPVPQKKNKKKAMKHEHKRKSLYIFHAYNELKHIIVAFTRMQDAP